MRILIIRHGETDHNCKRIMQGSLDTPLNARGEEQARDVQKLIHEREHIDAVYSSDLQRASRTAEIIADGKVGLIKIPEFRERFMGPIQGMNYEDAMQKLKRDNLPSLKSYGESQEQMVARLSSAWEILNAKARENGHKTVVVVSHGSALTTMFTHLAETQRVGFASPEVKRAFDENPRLSNCCVTIIEDDKFVTFAERWTDSIVRERELV